MIKCDSLPMYISNMPESVLMPYLQELVNPIFQQNTARPLTTRVTMEFLDDADIDLFP
jgi:hypothetical protein